ALAGAAMIEIAVLAGGALNNWRARRYGLEAGAELPGLTGYGLDIAAGPRQLRAACTALRLVSRRCGFCGQEEPDWRRLAPMMNAKHCELVLLLPGLNAAPYYPRASRIPEIVWVPLDWARTVNLLVSPTTILTYKGRIRWVRQGGLGPVPFSILTSEIETLPNDYR